MLRELHPEVSETAEPVDRDEIARARAAVAQRVERRHACTHERRGVGGGQAVGHPRERRDRRDHVLAVAAVVRDAGDRRPRDAGEELAAPARIAPPAIAAVPADADALADRPPFDVGPDRIDAADHLVPRHARQRDARKRGQLREGIAVADSARVDRDTHGVSRGLRALALDELERTVGSRDLRDAHGRHEVNVARSRRHIPKKWTHAGSEA